MVHLSCTKCKTFNACILWLRMITLVDWSTFCCKTLQLYTTKCYSELRSTASLRLWIDNVYNYIKYKISKYICLILRCDGKILHFLFSMSNSYYIMIRHRNNHLFKTSSYLSSFQFCFIWIYWYWLCWNQWKKLFLKCGNVNE